MNYKSVYAYALIAILLVLGACGGLSTSGGGSSKSDTNVNPGDNNSRCRVFDSTGRCTDDENANSSSIRMNWGAYRNHISGLAASQYVEGRTPNGSDFRGNYCFSNNIWKEFDIAGNMFTLNCAKASSSLRSTISFQPVAIQHFRLKVSKVDYHSVTFEGATVKTAVLKFNTSTGEPVFADKRTSTFGEGCNLNNANAVGFDESRSGEERILTSMQFFDEYDVCHTNISGSLRDYYCRSYLSAGKLWYSGLIPFASNKIKFQFDYVPASRPEEQTFGALNYADLNDSNSIKLPQFGAHDNDAGNPIPDYPQRVITGVCIRGYKQRTSSASTKRNLFLGAKIRTHRPRLSE